MIGDPPSKEGAFQLTDACDGPVIAETLVGAFDSVAGVTEPEGLDEAPIPTRLIAATVNTYDVPFVRPTMSVVVAVVVAVKLPGLEETV